MVRNQYNEQLAELKSLLTEMGDLNSQAIAQVVAALKSPAIPPRKEGELYGSVSVVRAIKRYENAVDEKESEIERLCLKLIIRQQPVASDLLFITSAMKMITDMERIGDQAEDIAEIISFLHGHQAEDNDLLREMAKAAIRMVTESVDAYVKCDTMLAEQVIAEDDTVDGYFTQVKERLIGKIAQDPADGEYALDLLMIAKYFERIGDHATNIAEWVIFSVTGVHKGG